MQKNNSDLFQADLFGGEPIPLLIKPRIGDIVRFELPEDKDVNLQPRQNWTVRVAAISSFEFGEYAGITEYHFKDMPLEVNLQAYDREGNQTEYSDRATVLTACIETKNHQDFSLALSYENPYINDDDNDIIWTGGKLASLEIL